MVFVSIVITHYWNVLFRVMVGNLTLFSFVPAYGVSLIFTLDSLPLP